jgi:hypothetical protein
LHACRSTLEDPQKSSSILNKNHQKNFQLIFEKIFFIIF